MFLVQIEIGAFEIGLAAEIDRLSLGPEPWA
jgi:hypothetical protein